MLTHLKMAGKLERLAGLVFGDFTQCNGEGPRNVREIIDELFHEAPIRWLWEYPQGGGKSRIALWRRNALDADVGTLSLIESPVVVMHKLPFGTNHPIFQAKLEVNCGF